MVSSFAPAKIRNGFVTAYETAKNATASSTVTGRTVVRQRFAPSRSPSPRRRATIAFVATLIARKTA